NGNEIFSIIVCVATEVCVLLSEPSPCRIGSERIALALPVHRRFRIPAIASIESHILVGAIETRSLPSSLAAARHGFTFYLADPSARLTSIAEAVRVNRPYL